MIQYRNNDKELWKKITPTVFPDGCSQVWQIENFKPHGGIEIKWSFESEPEFIQLLQLVQLTKIENGFIKQLHIPYMPYARQDKNISNNGTFGKSTFMNALELTLIPVHIIFTYDIHSIDSNIARLKNIRPDHFLKVIAHSAPDVLLFPDESAMKRYQKLFEDDKEFLMIPKMYAVKKRNQKTGEITSYEIYRYKDFIEGNKVLIMDDLCDGGATFVQAATELQKLGVYDIELCVSHGVFSKGLKPLEDAGIKHFYTTDSFLKGINPLKDNSKVTIYNI